LISASQKSEGKLKKSGIYVAATQCILTKFAERNKKRGQFQTRTSILMNASLYAMLCFDMQNLRNKKVKMAYKSNITTSKECVLKF